MTRPGIVIQTSRLCTLALAVAGAVACGTSGRGGSGGTTAEEAGARDEATRMEGIGSDATSYEQAAANAARFGVIQWGYFSAGASF